MSKGVNAVSRMERIARERFGYEGLYPAQRVAIDAVVSGRDVLAVMPTGSGKSAIYQIGGMMLPGPTVVVSPLLALQRDQAEVLEEIGAGEAAVVNSTVTAGERQEALEDVREQDVQYLFTAPEQFHNEDTLDELKAARPSLFVVDEAHCISEWGDDFRPDFLRLGAVVEHLGHPPVLALTATAAGPVRDDIVERLGLRDPLVLVEGFDRPNIWLGVERFHDETVKRRELVAQVAEAIKPGIVYTATRKHAEEIAEALREDGCSAQHYHAGMKSADRQDAEHAFMNDEIEVMVATNAFGMGIDKPNVRFVFHYDIPESVDAYYQQLGRAGRDGELARALLFYRPEDLNIHHFFSGTGKVEREHVERVVEALDEHDGPVATDDLQDDVELSRAKLTTALARLEDVGAVEILPTGEVIEVETRARAEGIADEAIEEEEHRRATDRSRIDMMRGYAEVQNCRREYLLNYFGELFQPLCGNCDNCQAGLVVRQERAAMPFPIGSRVTHQTLGEGTVQRYEGDKMVVLFDDVGYKTLLTEFVMDTGALQTVS